MECYAAAVEQARAEKHPRHVFLGGHSWAAHGVDARGERFPLRRLILSAIPCTPPASQRSSAPSTSRGSGFPPSA